MWGARETRKGKVVYSRKTHVFRASDLVRLAMRIKITGADDAGKVAAALIFCELKLEDFAFGAGAGQNLAEIYPFWYQALSELSGTKYATKFRQLYPIEADTLAVVLEAWKALAAIKTIEKEKPDVVF